MGAWREGLGGIDGFYAGRPIQIKTLDSDRHRNVLDRANEAERNAMNHGYRGVSLFLRAENIERDRLVDFARRGALILIPQQGTIHSIDILVKNGQWIHIEGGQIR